MINNVVRRYINVHFHLLLAHYSGTEAKFMLFLIYLHKNMKKQLTFLWAVLFRPKTVINSRLVARRFVCIFMAYGFVVIYADVFVPTRQFWGIFFNLFVPLVCSVDLYWLAKMVFQFLLPVFGAFESNTVTHTHPNNCNIQTERLNCTQ